MSGCLFCAGKAPPPGARCKYCRREGARLPAHTCHAKGCNREVPPKLLMCTAHWRMVPRDLQRKVWLHYVPGQEIKKNPTREYLEVMRAAIQAVAMKEGRAGE